MSYDTFHTDEQNELDDFVDETYDIVDSDYSAKESFDIIIGHFEDESARAPYIHSNVDGEKYIHLQCLNDPSSYSQMKISYNEDDDAICTELFAPNAREPRKEYHEDIYDVLEYISEL